MSNSDLIRDLVVIVGEPNVVHKPEDLIVFEYDGSVDRAIPTVVVLPRTTEEVSGVVKAAGAHGVPVIARGAGTGLSGGAIAEHGGIVVALTRMTSILEIDEVNRLAVLEPGVVNIDLTAAASKYGLYYAPDPSSQKACTIGGNVAENSGGPHCLAYGVTTNHVLGMEVVLADGSVHWYGGKTREAPGYDLRGIMIGSEGTLGIVTKVVVRLLKAPEAVKTLLAMFKTVEDASSAVSGIIGAGIVPAAIEMMDAMCIRAAEASMNAGYPEEAGAVLLVEVDGLREEVEEEAEEIANVCRTYEPMEILTATSSEERERLWAARKGVIGALGWLAPNYYLVDGTVPRTKLMEVLREVEKVAEESELPIANLLHAGDGNLHPLILFDERKPGDTDRALEAGGKILEICLDAGGVLSGEHGIGLEKQEYMPLMFSQEDMDAMAQLKPAFGSEEIFNPGKIFPTGASHGARHPEGGFAKTAANAFV
ncbi:MAG: FAD-binding protein [Dehalococcoidia bacterium]|nr:FAD-binding protein [Dehalococcoidia bacterium]